MAELHLPESVVRGRMTPEFIQMVVTWQQEVTRLHHILYGAYAQTRADHDWRAVEPRWRRSPTPSLRRRMETCASCVQQMLMRTAPGGR